MDIININKKQFNKKRLIAIITILIVIINMFFPYSILFNTKVEAGTGVLEPYPVILTNLGITTIGSNRVLKVEVAMSTAATINGHFIHFFLSKAFFLSANPFI